MPGTPNVRALVRGFTYENRITRERVTLRQVLEMLTIKEVLSGPNSSDGNSMTPLGLKCMFTNGAATFEPSQVF